MRDLALLLLSLAATQTSAFGSSGAKPKNAILLSQVQSLTLQADRQTTHRRVPSIPQLRCISSPKICALHKIGTLRCVNTGHSYTSEDIEWACTASLPSTLKLGSTEVICEGYSSPEDPYVLKGSCGVEYRLALTEEGERQYPELVRAGAGFWGSSGSGNGEETDWAGYIFGIIFFAVLAWIIWSACVQAGANRAGGGQARRRWGGGGGGGGGGGWGPGGWGGGPWNDPPPPYPGTKQGDQGWRPGFWTGLASGAAAGYMAGNRRDNREEARYNRGWGRDQFGGSGWASGSGSRPSPSSSSSSARHESTGFGSTSRR